MFLFRLSTERWRSMFLFRLSTERWRSMFGFRLSTEYKRSMFGFRLSTEYKRSIFKFRLSTELEDHYLFTLLLILIKPKARTQYECYFQTSVIFRSKQEVNTAKFQAELNTRLNDNYVSIFYNITKTLKDLSLRSHTYI